MQTRYTIVFTRFTTIFQTIKQAIGAIKNFIANNDTIGKEIARDLAGNQQKLEEYEKLWVSAFKAATRNKKAADKNRQENNGVKSQEVNTSEVNTNGSPVKCFFGMKHLDKEIGVRYNENGMRLEPQQYVMLCSNYAERFISIMKNSKMPDYMGIFSDDSYYVVMPLSDFNHFIVICSVDLQANNDIVSIINKIEGNVDERYRYTKRDIYRHIELYDRRTGFNEGRPVRNSPDVQHFEKNGQNGGVDKGKSTKHPGTDNNNNQERALEEGSRDTEGEGLSQKLKFSVREPVEQVGNLVAVHNLDENMLKGNEITMLECQWRNMTIKLSVRLTYPMMMLLTKSLMHGKE